MILLSLTRSLAFVIDGILILVLLIIACSFAAITWLFIGGGTFEHYVRSLSFPYGQFTFLLVVVAFAIRDFFSGNGKIPTAMHLLGLRARFSLESKTSRFSLALIRSSLFFVIPYAFVSYPLLPWDHFQQRSVWSFGAASSSLIFACALTPISVVAGRGQVGIHDLVLGCRITKKGELYAPSGRSLVLRLLIAYFICLAVAASVSLAALYWFPNGAAKTEHYMKDVVAMNLDFSGILERDGSSRDVQNFVERGLIGHSGIGPRGLIDRYVETTNLDAIAGHIFEWNIRVQTKQEAVLLRDGPTIPAGTHFWELKVWVSRAAAADPILTLMIVDAAASSIFRANSVVSAILVSIENSAQIGPAVAIQTSGVWALPNPKGGAALYSTDSVPRSVLKFSFGSDRLSRYSSF